MVDTLTPVPLRAQAVFRVALDALARPGRVYRLPGPPPDAPSCPWAATLLLTLLDHETSLWIAPPLAGAGPESLETYLRQRTGARLAPLEEAGFALADAATVGDAPLEEVVGRLRRGTLAYPDEGATLVLSVPAVQPDDGQRPPDGLGLALAVSGPGVPVGEQRVLRVQGLGAGFVAARAAVVGDYPAGIDLYLVDGAGRLAGLPRSAHCTTHLEANGDGV